VTHRLAQLEMSTGLVAQPLSTEGQSPQQSRRSRTSQSSWGSGSRRRGDEEDDDEEGRTPPSSGRRSGPSSRRVAWGDDGPAFRVPAAAGAGLFGFMADIIGGTCNVASAALDGASRQRVRTPVEDVDDDDHKQRVSSSMPARRRGLVPMVQQAVDHTEAQLASIRRMRACSVLNPAAALAASRRAAAATASGAVPPVRVPSEREQQLEHIHDGAPAARPAAQAPAAGNTSAPRPAARRKPRRILYDSETEDDTEDEAEEEGLLSQDDDVTVTGSDHSGSHFTGDSSEEERWSRAMGRTGTGGAATPAAAHDAPLPPELLAAQSALARVQQTETGLAEDALRLPPPPPPVRLRASRTPTAAEAALPEVLGLPPLRPPPKQHATEQAAPAAGSTVSRGGRLKGSSSRQSGAPPPPPPPSTLLSTAGPARPLLTQMRAPSVASTTWEVPASLNPPTGKDRRVRF
jgi:guanyl-specific ribonuclease Sa